MRISIIHRHRPRDRPNLGPIIRGLIAVSLHVHPFSVLYKWTRRTNLAQVNVNGASGIALDAVINKLRYFFLRSVRPCMSMWLCLLAY